MSCFICENNTFKTVTKICWLYGMRKSERSDFPLTLGDLDEFVKKVAAVNCKNYSLRYNEEAEVEVELFSDLPSFEIVPQDIQSTKCWMYQSEDYMDKDPVFKMVEEALEWAVLVTNFSKEEMDQTDWR